MAEEVATPYGPIESRVVMATKYVANGEEFDTIEDAARHLKSESIGDVLSFARWLISTHGDIPREEEHKILPIIHEIRNSGLDFADMAARIGNRLQCGS